MDFKSPLAKRQKVKRTTFNDIRDELIQVIQLRKNAGEIINEVCSAETTALLKFLAKTEVELNNLEQYAVPETDKVLQSSNGLSRKHDETSKKCCEHIMLLNILENKQNCPIAKIIDDI